MNPNQTQQKPPKKANGLQNLPKQGIVNYLEDWVMSSGSDFVPSEYHVGKKFTQLNWLTGRSYIIKHGSPIDPNEMEFKIGQRHC